MFWKIAFMQCIVRLLLFATPSTAAALQTKPSIIKASTPSEQENTTSAGITDIVTNVRASEGNGIQFIIRWKDDMPKDTSYNIVINTLNKTGCGEPPCSVYGVTKAAKEICIPENATTNVEYQNECGFEFGCNYSVKVETSNAAISGYGAVSVPYCIMGICSCQHAGTLPEIISSVNIPNNETIIFNWSIKNVKGFNFIEHQRINDTNNEWKLYLVISEQTNPQLSWGGKLIPITEHLFPLKKDTMQGSYKIRLPRQLASKAVLKLRSYIIDDLHCGGPEHFAKVTVPQFVGIEENNNGGGSDVNLVIVLNILCVFSICIIILVATYYCWWRRNKATKFHNDFLKHGRESLAKFPTVLEMEDNINYVDKYIEEAQEKGLADIYEIAHNKIHIGPEIGEGAFGRVYKAVAVNLRQMRGSTVVAVKQLKSNPTADEVSEFLSEIEMLKRVGFHKNIVSFLGCCTIRAPYLMVMEFVGRGDLLTYLRTVRLELSNLNSKSSLRTYKTARTEERKIKYIELQVSAQSLDSTNENNQHQPKSSIAETTYTIIENDEDLNEPFEYILDHKELYDFALQIANGMRFLEEQNITHRDLAARNILIDDSKTLKISDFGLSRHGIYSNTKTRKLPLRWLSIEAIRDNIYSSKSDIWAYGVVLWEIGTLGASPYPTISNHELIPYLRSGKRLEKPEICTEQLFAIMLQCWHEDAKERPTFIELYQLLSFSVAAYVDITNLSDDYVFPPI